ncbi:SufD family Fe-S cluster assembly protein [Stetteria hydrogenophila]
MAGSDSRVPRYTWGQLRELASKLPYQEIKDSPVIPYYTNWNRLKRAETAEPARETEQPPLPPGVSRVDAILGAPGDCRIARGKRLSREDLPFWSMPVDSRMDAVHAVRWHCGVAVDEPGEYVILLAGGAGYAGHHVEINVPAGSAVKAVIMEYTPRQGAATRTIKAIVNDGSTLDLTLITLDEGVSYTVSLIELGREASVTGRVLILPGEMTHTKVNAVLRGEKSKAMVGASTLAWGKVWSDLITNTLHIGAETEGTIIHRGIAKGGAFAVHRGGAKVEQSSEWSAAAIETSFLSVDDKSTAVAVPVLEVDTGNVRDARHSAVVAPPPGDALFYLAQRGLTREEALTLMEEGILAAAGVHEALGVDVADLYSWVLKVRRVEG